MKQYTRICCSVVFVALTVCVVGSFVGCNEQKDSSKLIENKEDANKRMALLLKPNQELIVILSVKYGQDINVVEKLIDQYLTETDIKYRSLNKHIKPQNNEHDIGMISGTLDKSSYFESINQLSRDFSLDSSVVASILFDYILWVTTKESVKLMASRD